MSIGSMEGLVSSLAKSKTVRSDAVRRAFLGVDRRYFANSDPACYEDRPLPIGFGQTISAPHVHALALELARDQIARTQRDEPSREEVWILDVGSGSGYLTGAFAILLKEMNVNGRVVGIERYDALADRSIRNLLAAGLGDLLRTGAVDIQCKSAFAYSPGHAYDFIHVGAAATEVPMNLVSSLRDGGQLLVPLGPHEGIQEMSLVTRRGSKIEVEELLTVRYVPLVDDD